MLAKNLPTFLLASPEPALLAIVDPVLAAAGARVEIVLSAHAALAAMTAPNPPGLALLDSNLPGMEMGQLLAEARAGANGPRFPIVLISDTVTQEWLDRVADGVIDDVILRAPDSLYWQLRLNMVLRARRQEQELGVLREAATLNAQRDRLTGVYNREAMLAMLFRETDRVQRMSSSLCLVLFDIDDFGHWNSRLGVDACDELLCQVVERTARLLRSYDLLGRPGMEMGQLLAEARAGVNGPRFPIVLISDTVTQEWLDRVTDGVIDDVILRAPDSLYWQLRLDMVLRARRQEQELGVLREAATLNAQRDRLTGVYNREAMLAMLFRETDRVQRMSSSLSLVLFDIDDFGHWNSRLGVDACDELLCQVVGRTARLLRSYDLLGRPGMDEFLVALPSCTTANAFLLAERLRLEVFSSPYRVGGESIRLSACFGIASSGGRSPIIVLREAEQALKQAKEAGPESIQCFNEKPRSTPAPVIFLSPASGDKLLAW